MGSFKYPAKKVDLEFVYPFLKETFVLVVMNGFISRVDIFLSVLIFQHKNVTLFLFSKFTLMKILSNCHFGGYSVKIFKEKLKRLRNHDGDFRFQTISDLISLPHVFQYIYEFLAYTFVLFCRCSSNIFYG